jgi:hypothetical protein
LPHEPATAAFTLCIVGSVPVTEPDTVKLPVGLHVAVAVGVRVGEGVRVAVGVAVGNGQA